MVRLEISLLGTFQVTSNGGGAVSIESDKAQALLAYLALAPNRLHRRDALAALLWPETSDRRARQSLRQVLYTLRQVLAPLVPVPAGVSSGAAPVTTPTTAGATTPTTAGATAPATADAALLETTRQHVRLAADDCSLDVTNFTDLLLACQVHPHRDIEACSFCGERLRHAIELYRGDLLAGLSLADSQPFEEWRLALQEELHGRALEALRHLANYYERRREYEHAVRILQRELALEPWREEVHRQQMRVLALSGRRAAALAQYRACCRALAEELDIVPSAETTALFQRIEAGVVEPERISGPNPYKGLSAFAEADAADFYGREAFAGRLLLAVQRSQGLAAPVVALVGPSGSGKSSLVHAGLLPRLRMSGGWAVANLRPGDHPFRRLVDALALLLPGSVGVGDDWCAAVAKDLREGERCLAEMVAEMPALRPGLARPGASAERRLLIVIDAFEELYTLCTDPGCRRAFLDLLFRPIADQPRTVFSYTVLFTLRADLFGQALAYPGMDDLLRQGCLILGQMSREGLQRAIEEPAKAHGVAYEPGLVMRLLHDVGDEPGNLPMLQFTLTQLWGQQQGGRLTHAAYDEIGGVAGALTGYAEHVYERLSPGEKKTARRVFTRMVRPGQGAQDARRPVMRAELSEGEWDLVRKLADARLVVTGRDAGGEETAEMVHEALIRAWGRLRTWLDADLAFHFWLQRLRTEIRQWQVSGRDEGALLRGALLTEAEEWTAGRVDDLSDGQRAFIAASVALRDREQSEAKARARALERAVQLSQSMSLAANARLALRDQDTELALALALEANRVPAPPPEVQRVLAEAAYAPGTSRLLGRHGLYVRCVAVSADGRTALSGAADCMLVLWDVERGKALRRFKGHEGTVFCLAYSPDGRTALSGSGDRTLILWDLATGEALRRLQGHRQVVLGVAFMPDGLHALSSSVDRSLILWDLSNGKVIRRYEGHSEEVRCLDVSPDGRTALSGGGDGSVILWDVASGGILHYLAGEKGHAACVRDVTFLPSGDTALSVSEDRSAVLWDVQSGDMVRRFELLQVGGLYSVEASPDGRWALIGTRDSPALLLDLESGHVTRSRFGRRGRIEALVLHPDGRHVFSGTNSGDLRLSELRSGAELRCLEYARARIAPTAVDVSPDGRWRLVGFRDGSVSLWDIDSGTEVRRLVGHLTPVTGGVRFLPGGRTAISASGGVSRPSPDSTLRVWDLETGRERCRFEGHTDPVSGIDVSADGRTVVSSSADGTVRLWKIPAVGGWSTLEGESICGSGRILHDYAPQEALCAALAPDGRTAFVGLDKGRSDTPDYALRLLDVQTGREVRRLIGHDEPVKTIALSLDGRTALSGALNGTIFVWDVESGEMIRRLEGHTGTVLCAVLGPEGHIAVTSSQDTSVIVWNLATGEAIRRYVGHHGEVTGLCFTPGGRTVISAGADLTVREWRIDATQDELLAWIRDNRYVPELTPEQRALYQVDLLGVQGAGGSG